MKKLAFSVLAFFLCLLLLELAARLLEPESLPISEKPGPGWQTEFFRSFINWDEPDPDLLWRFKAGLRHPLIKTNSEHLLGEEISKRKEAKNFRILLLGDSSPVGFGLKARWQAFGESVREMLEIEFQGKIDVELVNAAVPGYTSEQIARFLTTKGWGYQPDLVILYCGNNDASLSGPYADRELLEGQKLKTVRRLLSHSALYRMLRWELLGRQPSRTAPQELKLRVSADRFSANLAKIAEECRNHQCPLIILKPPVPYLWPAGLQFKIFSGLSREGRLIMPPEMTALLGRPIKYCLDAAEFQKRYGAGDPFTREVYASAYADSLPPEQAVNYYLERHKADPEDPVLTNNLGVSFWEDRQYGEAGRYLMLARSLFLKREGGSAGPAVQAAGAPFLFNIGINLWSQEKKTGLEEPGMKDPAFQYLDSALQFDFFSLRIKRDYWEKIDRFKDERGVTVIDLPEIFRQGGGERLFIDHCHPTAEGHRLIAGELLKVIRPKIQTRISQTP